MERDKLNKLSVKELKAILQKNGVDYRDCIDKKDFIQKIEKYCPNALISSENAKTFKPTSNDEIKVIIIDIVTIIEAFIRNFSLILKVSKHIITQDNGRK